MEGFRQNGLALNPLPGLIGLFMVAAVNPEPLGNRRGRIVSLGLRTAVAAVEGRAGLVVVERTAVVVVVAGVVAVAFWVVTEGWTPSIRSSRSERFRPSTDVMSASKRTGNAGKEELLKLQSAST